MRVNLRGVSIFQMPHTHAGAQLGEIGGVQINIGMSAAVVGFLNIFNHTVATIVHQQHEKVDFFLRSASQLTHIQDESTIATQRYCFNSMLRRLYAG